MGRDLNRHYFCRDSLPSRDSRCRSASAIIFLLKNKGDKDEICLFSAVHIDRRPHSPLKQAVDNRRGLCYKMKS